jgi:hypothetical protein
LSGVVDLISKLVMVHSVEVESAPLSLRSPLPALFLERKLQVLSVFDVVFDPISSWLFSSRQIPLFRLQQLHPPILRMLCSDIPRDLVCYRRACAIMAVSLASIRFASYCCWGS